MQTNKYRLHRYGQPSSFIRKGEPELLGPFQFKLRLAKVEIDLIDRTEREWGLTLVYPGDKARNAPFSR